MKESEAAHIVHPKEAGVECGALVLLEELQICLVNITICQSLLELKQDIDVPRPLSNDFGNESGAKLLGLPALDQVDILDSSDCGENYGQDVGRGRPPSETDM